MSEDKSASYHRSRSKSFKKTLQDSFFKDEGVVAGESSVISQKVHVEPPDSEGTVYIYSARDAGLTYLKLIEQHLVLHIDVFHNPADINIFDLADRIRFTISNYLDLTEDVPLEMLPEREMLILNLAQRIYLKTYRGEGTVLNPASCPSPPGAQLPGHVHILAKIPDKYYGLVYFLIDQIEKAISYQGYNLRPVNKLVPIHEQTASEEFPLGVPLTHNDAESPLEVKLQNYSQVLVAIAEQLGGLEIAESFMELISPLRIISLSRFGKRYPCMDKILEDLAKLGYIKKEAFGYSFTNIGKELKKFLKLHRKELATLIRKAIRHIPPTPGVTPSGHFCRVKSHFSAFYDKRKAVERDRDNWYNPIAIPETVIKAAKRSILQDKTKFEIKEQDLMVFKKRCKAPVDICMVVDCSGSMKGAKLQAVQWVAEYLVLTTRDKVALISFQERDAHVIVPFTKSYTNLHHNLLNLQPEGLTPLAKGLVTALDLITKSKPRNPLLALITDGKPNTPLFSTDPVADAIKVCTDFPKNKIRFLIIGIDPSKEFIPRLAEAGQGNYYLVDDIDRSNLINIMRSERKMSTQKESK